jgi:hypothetical protein
MARCLGSMRTGNEPDRSDQHFGLVIPTGIGYVELTFRPFLTSPPALMFSTAGFGLAVAGWWWLRRREASSSLTRLGALW